MKCNLIFLLSRTTVFFNTTFEFFLKKFQLSIYFAYGLNTPSNFNKIRGWERIRRVDICKNSHFQLNYIFFCVLPHSWQ